MKTLTLDELLAADDLREVSVEVPEWGGAVTIKALTKGQQQEARELARVAGEVDWDRFEVQLVIASLIAPRVDQEHFELLRRKSARAMDRLLIAVRALNSLEPTALGDAVDRFPG